MLGLARGTVFLSPYTDKWRETFEHERHDLEKVFVTPGAAIEHVGSTAIPGMMAKPIMDIVVGLDSIGDLTLYTEALHRLGYVFRRDYRETEQYHVLFVKGPESKRTHYLKLTEKSCNFWRNNLAFRDYMRSHPDRAAEYQRLKIRLAAQYPDDRDNYTLAKGGFIRDILELAGESRQRP